MEDICTYYAGLYNGMILYSLLLILDEKIPLIQFEDLPLFYYNPHLKVPNSISIVSFFNKDSLSFETEIKI